MTPAERAARVVREGPDGSLVFWVRPALKRGLEERLGPAFSLPMTGDTIVCPNHGGETVDEIRAMVELEIEEAVREAAHEADSPD